MQTGPECILKYPMLFRTKVIAAFLALVAVAIGCAAVLMLSTWQSASNNVRANLAHDNLSGYFQLYGAVFRTFKLARRDLLSGPGSFAFDFDAASNDIRTTLAEIKTTSRAEINFKNDDENLKTLDRLALMESEVIDALEGIAEASTLITTGHVERGRAQAVAVLEGQVDSRIGLLIDEAIAEERADLDRSRADIERLQSRLQLFAGVTVMVTVLVSGAVLLTLLRRFRRGLSALATGATAYSNNELDHVITLPGRDELSVLAAQFTGMARQIQLKQQDLEKARDELETRVSERTAELSKVNAELRESDALRRQFFADIGHELRTPVTAIRGEAEVALRARRNQEEAQKSALKTIVSLSEELTDRVSDLFLIAREQAGVLEFRTDRIDLSQAAERGIEQMQSLKRKTAARISSKLSHEPLKIVGDSARISQLVRLLIGNALQHGHDTVEIQVATYAAGGMGVLEVSDDGPGIAEQDHGRIFDRYIKRPTGSEHSASGTGLGLAIAKSIAQAHGGRISVASIATGGARFAVHFPLGEAAA